MYELELRNYNNILLYLCSIVESPLGVDDLFVVLEELYDAQTHWYNLGLGLRLKSNVLDAIEKQCPGDCSKCFRDTLKDYLNTLSPSWRALVKALRSPIVNLPKLAETVEQNHCPAVRPGKHFEVVSSSLKYKYFKYPSTYQI